MRIFLSFLLFASCAAAALEAPLSCTEALTTPVENHLSTDGGYLSLKLSYAPTEKLRKELEARLGIKLKNRGEAHITVLAPQELELLNSLLGEKQVAAIAAKAAQDFSVEPVCVGMGQVGKDRTYFVVVKAPFFMRVREALAKAAGSDANFQPLSLDPHITLGFTNRDLHGIDKAERSCIYSFE